MGHHLKPFVRGYAFDREKIGAVFEFDHLKDPSKVLSIIGFVLERIVNSEADVALTVVYKPGAENEMLSVIVIDDDFDEEKLKNRPMRPLHPELDQYMNILTGPCVWMEQNNHDAHYARR
ncbi:hypothetical protein CVT25_014801 [Psilocybe cyanescens]|uniref:Uncharacterized protein n=1 Tax=Psilocybe cyanescens TaxID=93625 RepID=A0A409X5E6_PSICY|nr:hypothetical protein CVT25_014801 [Psilocybe cyanescens]